MVGGTNDVQSFSDGMDRRKVIACVFGHLLTSIIGCVLGSGLIVASTALQNSPTGLRMALFFAGAASLLSGLSGIVRWLRGPRVDPLLWLAAGWLVLFGFAAVFAGLLPLSESHNPAAMLLEPSMLGPDLLSRHPLGTDTAALDVLGQIIYGARVSIVVALGGALIGGTIGGGLGLLSGYLGGYVEAVIVFVMEVLLSFPPLFLLMAMVTVLVPTVANLTVALGILVVPAFTRLARANTLKVASREYVLAARTLGTATPRILLSEILPNIVPALVAYGFIIFGLLIVAEASLSFLGLGIQRPQPSWGNLISQGEQYLQTSPHLVVGPTLFLFLTVLSANYVGQFLQRQWTA